MKDASLIVRYESKYYVRNYVTATTLRTVPMNLNTTYTQLRYYYTATDGSS